MTPNVGTLDRLIRAALGVALLAFALLGATGALQWIALVVGLVMLGVAALRVCPLYSIFGLRTCRT